MPIHAADAAGHRPDKATTFVPLRTGDVPALKDLFSNLNPLEIEVGCGKGKFLIARAVEHPTINFIGIDVVWKWMKFAVQRADKRGLANLRFFKQDARRLIREGLEPGSVSVFHIYFPDPWPKRRHRKRRIVSGEFLRLLHERLEDGGTVELATDHEDYFAHMRAAVAQSGCEWVDVTEKQNERLFVAQVKTNYEIKYAAAGRQLYYLRLRKPKQGRSAEA